MRIEKNLTYMEHSGGTKFYEAAVFSCATNGRYVVVRRWGKTTSKRRGGEVKIETFAERRAALSAHGKVVSEKGGRGYIAITQNFGLKSGSDEFEHDMLRTALEDHYSMDTASAVMERLDLAAKAAGDAEWPTVAAKPAVAEKKAEPVRSDDWASW